MPDLFLSKDHQRWLATSPSPVLESATHHMGAFFLLLADYFHECFSLSGFFGGGLRLLGVCSPQGGAEVFPVPAAGSGLVALSWRQEENSVHHPTGEQPSLFVPLCVYSALNFVQSR